MVGDLGKLPRAGCVVAETSTFTLADKTTAQAQLAEAGIAMLDCPLSGSGSQALVRDVLVYGSGERELYNRCLPASRPSPARRIISGRSATARR